MSPNRDLPGELASPQDLDQRTLVRESLPVQVLGRDLVEVGRLDHVQVDGLVLDPEGVLEALELGHPHVERHLPALEVGLERAARPLALHAASGGLAAAPGDAAAHTHAAAVRAVGRLQIVDFHGVTPLRP